MYQQLSYNKQFILSNQILSFEDWKSHRVHANLHLLTHPNLEVSKRTVGDRGIILLGNAFDYQNPKHSNQDILDSLGDKLSFEEVTAQFDNYVGNFLVIHTEASSVRLFHDALGLYEVFYYQNDGLLLCASQPRLIGQFASLTCSNKEKNRFYNSSLFAKRRIRLRHQTQYDKLYRLKPNHTLDLASLQQLRFFPTKPISTTPFKKAVKEIALRIKGVTEAMSHRKPLTIAVTGGIDSRIALAATRDLNKDKCHYYVYKKPGYSDNHLDIKQPKLLLKKLGLPFEIVQPTQSCPKEFAETLNNQVEYPFVGIDDYLYKFFVEGAHTDCLDLTVVSEVMRTYYNAYSKCKTNGKLLAYLSQYPNEPYAVNTYQEWIDKEFSVIEALDYDPLDFFYWEENMGNWAANSTSHLAVVTDAVNPINSREIINLALTVGTKYRDKYGSKLSTAIIWELWPACLQIPVNNARKYKMIRLLTRLQVYKFYKRMKYRLQ